MGPVTSTSWCSGSVGVDQDVVAAFDGPAVERAGALDHALAAEGRDGVGRVVVVAVGRLILRRIGAEGAVAVERVGAPAAVEVVRCEPGRASGHSDSSRQVLAPMTKIRTGGSASMPFSMPRSRRSYQRRWRPSRSMPASGPKSTSPIARWCRCRDGTTARRPVSSGDASPRSGPARPTGEDLEPFVEQVVVPAGDEDGRHVDLGVAALHAVRLPVLVEGRVVDEVAGRPGGRRGRRAPRSAAAASAGPTSRGPRGPGSGRSSSRSRRS